MVNGKHYYFTMRAFRLWQALRAVVEALLVNRQDARLRGNPFSREMIYEIFLRDGGA